MFSMFYVKHLKHFLHHVLRIVLHFLFVLIVSRETSTKIPEATYYIWIIILLDFLNCFT